MQATARTLLPACQRAGAQPLAGLPLITTLLSCSLERPTVTGKKKQLLAKEYGGGATDLVLRQEVVYVR